ncbi:MAG TPA: exopolysaccharide transport family protein [Xanthobacteraceae bacterium]|nr:exopolysaccharide transport family protein [Xanthobacteraceae bacterium]
MSREGAYAGAEIPAETGEGALDLAALGRAIWRKRRWIVVPTLVAAFVSFVAVNLVTPRYKSETRILIESRETAYNRPDGERVVDRDRTPIDEQAVQSQVQLVQSRDLARKVVRDLKLAERSEFEPAVGWSLFYGPLSFVGLGRDLSRLSAEERVLERYYERLNVYPIEKSRVIVIEFQSQDPDLAAAIANKIAEEYLALQQQAKREAMRQAGQWLASEIDRMRGKVAEAEARVEEFRARSNLFIGPNNNTLNAQGLGELNSQLGLARSQKADLESKARTIRELLRSGRVVDATDVTSSELIRRLNEQRVTLRGQLAEQSSTLGPLHPRIKELKAQIADIEAQIRLEAEKLARSFENDVRIAGARIETLTVTLDQLKRLSSTGEDVQLRALEREAKAQRDLLESYLARYRDVSARESPDAVPPDARVISRAVASATPYFPKKLPIVLVATLATLLLVMAFIATGELLGGDIYQRGYVAAAAMAPRPAPVSNGEAKLPPWMRAREVAKAPPPSDPPPAEPPPPVADEAVAPIIEVAVEPEPPVPQPPPVPPLELLADQVRRLGQGSVVVTPASAGNGAPRVASALAQTLADGRANTVLVSLDDEGNTTLAADADAPGAFDLFAGRASFAEVIRRDPSGRVHVIGAGRGAGGIAALLAQPRLAILIGALARTYDHVIVATPALAGVTGAERLAQFARMTVLVTSPGDDAAVSDLAARGFQNVVLFDPADLEQSLPVA